MKRKKLFLALVVFGVLLGFSTESYSQAWTFRGFVTGAGTFPSISVYGPNSLMIFGGPNGSPYVARSTNGGTSFTPLGTTGVLLELYCGWAVDDNTIYAGDGGSAGGAGGNAKVYKTTNGGTSWSVILSTGGSLGFINGIVFSRTSTSNGVAQSDPPSGGSGTYWIAKTTDNGGTWNIQNPPSAGSGVASAQNSVICVDNLFYGFGLNAGSSRVDLTTDGGTTWNVRTLGVGGSFISGFAASSDKTYLIAASNTSLPNISRSTNGGVSFTTVGTGLGMGGYCTMKWVYGTSICYLSSATGAAGCIAKSTDNGATWTQINTASITGITHMELVNVGGVVYGYAVAGDGSVIGGVNPVGIDPINQNVPSEYRLEQNYPNPFNPSTTIKYALPKASNVTLKIYDMLGNEVMSVVDGHQAAGNYVETIDASSLASGVYFYKLSAGDFSDSKKMSVVK